MSYDHKNPPYIPSMEEVNEMDRKRAQAEQALEISETHVKCQQCRRSIRKPAGKLTYTLRTERARILQRRLKYLYLKGSRSPEIDSLKTELAEIEEDDAKKDKLRSLPLYSSKLSDFKYVCSSCFEKLYALVNK